MEGVGLSMAYLYPWVTFKPLGLLFARWLMDAAGCDWLELIVYRSVSPKLPVFLESRVKFIHTAYNPATFWQAARGKETSWADRARWRHFLLSPGPKRCFAVTKALGRQFPLINYYPRIVERNPWEAKKLLLEIYNGMGMSARETAAFSERVGMGLAIDTKYWRTNPAEKRPLGDWREHLTAVLPKTEFARMQAINSRELRRFVEGRQTELEEMINLIREFKGAVAIAVNLGPRNINLHRLIKALRGFERRVKSCL